MDITAIASAVSANATTQLQTQASLLVLKKAMEMQQAQAALLLQALPQAASAANPTATLGRTIDTFA